MAGAAGPGARPLISVIMASYCAERHIEAALASVLGQSLGDLEVIVCDDASRDSTAAVVGAVMRSDRRVRLVALEANGGPARSRNRALDEVRGEWIAIVDADDLLHPERFERMIAAARPFEADIIADDLLFFDEDARSVGHLLVGDGFDRPQPLTPEMLVGGRGAPSLGYLKPMIRTEVLAGARYDEQLRIGEDFDFLLRLLLRGATAVVIPEPWYLYRRHAASVSHRLSAADASGMIASAERTIGEEMLAPVVKAALEERIRSLRGDRDYADLVALLKAGNAKAAIHSVQKQPALLGDLFRSVNERTHRNGRALLQRLAGSVPPRAQSVLLTDRAGGDSPQAIEIVPPYTAPGEPAAGDRAAWWRVARLGLQPSVDLTWDGTAGAYAAGFSPGRWRARETVRPLYAVAAPAMQHG